MNNYIFTIHNGGFPLKHECESVADTFMCAVKADELAGRRLVPNLDSLLCALADMEAGRINSVAAGGYTIEVQDE